MQNLKQAAIAMVMVLLAAGANSAHADFTVENGKAKGKVEVATQADLARLKGVSQISGSLQIMNFDGADLAALKGLTMIEGDVTIFSNANLASLDGLANLEVVYGNVRIFSNPKLASVAGLAKLRSAYSLSVTDHPTLTKLPSQPLRLGEPTKNLKGFLQISGNPKLPKADADAFAAKCTLGEGAKVFVKENGN